MTQQAVLVYIKLLKGPWGGPDERRALERLEDRLEEVIDESGVGEFDGNEVGEGFWRLFTYGSNADRLFDVIVPIVRSWTVPPGSYVIKRYGQPGEEEHRFDL